MKITTIATTLFIAGIALAQEEPATDNTVPKTLVPVSVFTVKDIPEIEPGKPVWQSGACWNYGITRYGKWVYTTSEAGYILQFECDPGTAKLTYLGASPMMGSEGLEKNGVKCFVHLLDDGHAVLAIHETTDQRQSWLCYAIDKDTGRLTPEGKNLVARTSFAHAQLLLTPDRQHLYTGGGRYWQIDRWRFDDFGDPVADGSFPLKNPCRFSMGIMTFSPDWRYMYYLTFHSDHPDAARPWNDKTPLIDIYAIDPKTHLGTYLSSLELPFPKESPSQENAKITPYGSLEPFSPDGKHLYAIVAEAEKGYCYALKQDSSRGTLSIASQESLPDRVTPGYLKYLDGPDWFRRDRFAFAPDGLSGYYLTERPGGPMGGFTRDPATGILNIFPPLPDMGANILASDPVNGNLFTAGDKIASFKLSASANAFSK